MKSLKMGCLAILCTACAASSKGATTKAASSAPSIVITDASEWQNLTVAGKASFDTACGACHPGGEADLGPALKGHRLPVSDMTRQIREGSGRMKPIDNTVLPEDQLRGLMVYLSTLDAVGGVQGP